MRLRSIGLLVIAQRRKPEIHHNSATYQNFAGKQLHSKNDSTAIAFCVTPQWLVMPFKPFRCRRRSEEACGGGRAYGSTNHQFVSVGPSSLTPHVQLMCQATKFPHRTETEREGLVMLAQVLTAANGCNRKTEENQGNISI